MLNPGKEIPDERFKQLENIFLSVIFDTAFDGLLIISETGEIVKTTVSADKICSRLLPPGSCSGILPKEICRMLDTLLRSREECADSFGLVEEEISNDIFPLLYMRACWCSLPASNSPYILIVFEDRYSANCSIARTESIQYELTPRESEVWELSRNNRPQNEIANKLFISINTVKKHLKNIQMKKRMFYY